MNAPNEQLPAASPGPDNQHFVGLDHAGTWVWSRPNTHLLVCGPSQTGKTASVLAHAVMRARGATVTTSTKEDLLVLPPQHGTHHVLDLLGHTAVPAGMRTLRFSPLSLVHTLEDALLTGRTLMDSAYSFEGSGTTNEGYWTQRGSRVVAALLWAAHRGRRPVGQVFQWAAAQDSDTPLGYLAEDEQDDKVARDILNGLTVQDRQTRKPSTQAAAVWSFAQQAVALYAYPNAQRLAQAPNLDVDAFVRSSNKLHIVCPSTRAGELGPVIAVLIQALADARYRLTNTATTTSEGCQGSSAGRLTLILDEVANTAPLPTLPALCSEGAGQGVSLVLGTQDRAQLESRFGAEEARTIVNNCRDRLIMAELGDQPFLEQVEALSGTLMREEVATGTSDSGQGLVQSRNVTYREVAAWRAWEIAQLPVRTALHLTGWRPQLVDLLTWRGQSRTNVYRASPSYVNGEPTSAGAGPATAPPR